MRNHSNTGLLFLIIAMLLIALPGCRQEVQTSYLPPPVFDKSLNGVSVFNDMTTRRGHALRTEMVVNAYAKNCDVLVWFSRRTGCPKEETVALIERWLAAKPGRTFVYVGRAFESTVDYWNAVEEQNLAPTGEDRGRIAIRKNDAQSDLRSFLSKTNTASNKKDDHVARNTKCSWFETAPREREYNVTAISGIAEWMREVDADKLQLSCYEDWEFADDVDPLLVVSGETIVPFGKSEPVDDRVLVARKSVGESQAIFVTNAGFLLNYPLVNHEHRKLAGRLIDTFGSPKKRTCIYIGSSEIDFDRPDTPEEAPFLLTLLHIWPLSVILCHVIVLCSAFCFYKWPIFGRPRKLEEPAVTDFGKHIDAYAELLADAKDDDYVLNQIMEAYKSEPQR